MTPDEVRAIVERVVVEHGCGWGVEMQGPKRNLRVVAGPLGGNAGVVAERLDRRLPWSVFPEFAGVRGTACTRVVALWPEIQRLADMLREALHG